MSHVDFSRALLARGRVYHRTLEPYCILAPHQLNHIVMQARLVNHVLAIQHARLVAIGLHIMIMSTTHEEDAQRCTERHTCAVVPCRYHRTDQPTQRYRRQTWG